MSVTNFVAADVKALREQVGAGMTDAKKAPTEADGGARKVLEITRLRSLESLSKHENRQVSAGLLIAEVGDGVSVPIEISSETDFVAKNQKFIDFTNEILAAAVASRVADLETLLAAPMGRETVWDKPNNMAVIISKKLGVRRIVYVKGESADLYLHQTSPDPPPQIGVFIVTDTASAPVAHSIAICVIVYMPVHLDRDHVPADVPEKERMTLAGIALKEDKPKKIVDKIITGRLETYFKDNYFVSQAFAHVPSKSAGRVLGEAGAKITDFAHVHVGV